MHYYAKLSVNNVLNQSCVKHFEYNSKKGHSNSDLTFPIQQLKKRVSREAEVGRSEFSASLVYTLRSRTRDLVSKI